MNKLKIINPIIIAHSFGGRIAALLTGYYKQQIDKLILIDVAGIKPKKTLKKILKEKTYKTLKRLVKLLPSKKQQNAQYKLLKFFASSDYLDLPPAMHNTFKNIVNEDLTNYFSSIQSETLLLWGKNDLDTPLKDGIKINKLITNSALIVLKKAGHYSYLQYPILINNIINEFIKENDLD